MRIVLAFLLLLAPPILAANCLKLVVSPSPPQIVLRGAIDVRPANSPPGHEVFLKLSMPVCVEGVAPNGLPFKLRKIDSIKLGAPINLFRTLQTLHQVTLRGELWGPAENGETPYDFVFAVREVL